MRRSLLPVSSAIVAAVTALLSLPFASTAIALASPSRPNVILIITDDQGYGDLGIHGNPILQTPRLDSLAQQGARFNTFYVSPCCAPTRASLLTGRYCYRTGVVDTYLGRAMMYADEITLAEVLKDAGYRTGIFGKWHLGDTYPMRAMDQGFEESLVHRGGGIGQNSDPPGGSSYVDPILFHNGSATKKAGYCSDVYTDAAIEFIARDSTKPFFAYLAFNCPHAPLQCPKNYERRFQGFDFDPKQFPNLGHPLKAPNRPQKEQIAKVYGMVANIDDNVGRLLDALRNKGLEENTIVCFMTDNGPQIERYNAGMLDRKSSVHEGGIRVPLFVRWPKQIVAGKAIHQFAAAIDVFPTLLELCGVPIPNKKPVDGLSLAGLLTGAEKSDLPNRTLFVQWHRGDTPVRYRNCAVRSQRFKLVQPFGGHDVAWNASPKFELFAIDVDPLEQHNVADANPDIVAKMRAEYDQWYDTMRRERHFKLPAIWIGASEENPVTLTRQDWRGQRSVSGKREIGYWDVDVQIAGDYEFTLNFAPTQFATTATLKTMDSSNIQRPIAKGQDRIVLTNVRLAKGPNRFETILADAKGDVGVWQMSVRRLIP